MTADVELLPVAVSPYTDRILAAVRKQDCVDPLFRILDDYARATAEIEALRAGGVMRVLVAALLACLLFAFVDPSELEIEE